METPNISKQKEFQELLEYIVALYGEDQIAIFNKLGESPKDDSDSVNISTIINSSVYGY